MKTIIRYASVTAILLFINLASFGQLMIDNISMTPTQLVQNVLVGGGVTVSNVTFDGVIPQQIGRFYNGNTTNVGMDEGIILSSGDVTGAPGPNNTGSYTGTITGMGSDVDLQALIPGYTINDKAVLEFDLIPISDTVQFKYVFGSDEYPEWVNSSFNDVFGFFLSGPGLSGPYTNNAENIAIIPTTTLPVTIDNVNAGSYSMYYVDNTSGVTIQYDGFTTVLTAWHIVTPCVQYHIKIAVGDAGDSAYDSAVFLKKGSLISNGMTTQAEYSFSGDTVAIRNCTTASIDFVFSTPVTSNTTITYNIGGTATNGVDYQTIPNSVVVPAGGTTATITITPIGSGGTETIMLVVPQTACSSDTTILYIVGYPPVTLTTGTDTSLCEGASMQLHASVTGGLAPYTYLWSTGASTLTTSVTPTVSGSPYNYTFTVADKCSTYTDLVNVVVHPNPTSYFTAPGPVCEFDNLTITYTGTTVPGSTFVWDFDYGVDVVSGTGQGPYVVHWNGAGMRDITLTVTSPDGCVSTVTTHQVNVFGAGTTNCCAMPTPDAGLTQNICGWLTTMAASLPSPGNTAEWSVYSSPAGSSITFDYSDLNTTIVNVNMNGSYTFYWIEHSGNFCVDSDMVVVNFTALPSANAGTDNSVCGTSYTFSASSSGGTSTWYGPGTYSPGSTNPNATVTVNNVGIFTYVWEVTNNGCTSRDTTLIEFLAIPDPEAGPDQIICGTHVTLNELTHLYPGHWSGPAGTLFSPSDTSFLSNAYILPYVGDTTFVFTFTSNNGLCNGSDQVSVLFRQPPNAVAGLGGSTCNTTFQFEADVSGNPVVNGYWRTNIPGIVFDTITSPTAICNIIGTIPGIYGDDSYVVVPFTWTMDIGGGCIDESSTNVTFYQTPIAVAGVDTSVCGLSYQLQGHASVGASAGTWSTISGPLAYISTFENSHVDTSQVFVNLYGTYEFVWKENNANSPVCSDRDTVRITFLEVPSIDAGPDTSWCGNFAQMQAVSAGNPGTWSAPAGATWWDQPGGINNDALYRTYDTTWVRWPGYNETVTFVWQEYNGFCVARDSVHIYFGTYIPPSVLMDPDDTTWCGNAYPNLNADPPQFGHGHWVDAVSSTVFVSLDNYNPPSSDPSPDTAMTYYYGMHYFFWITDNGGCRDTSNVFPVRIIQKPHADAGPNLWPNLFYPNSEVKTDTACDPWYILDAQPSVGDGSWTAGATTTTWFQSTGNQITTMHNDTARTTVPSYNDNPAWRELFWTEDNEGCTDTDTLRLVWAPRPTAFFTHTQPWCPGDTSTLTAYTVPNSENAGLHNYVWNLDGGGVDTADQPLSEHGVVHVAWPNHHTITNHIISLRTDNQWECRSAPRLDTIKEPYTPPVNYDVTPATCHQSNGCVVLDSLNNVLVFEWDSLLFTYPTGTSQCNLMADSVYTVDVTGPSYSVDAPSGFKCKDTVMIHIPDIGEVTAKFDTINLPDGIVPHTVVITNLSENGSNYQWFVYDATGALIFESNIQTPSFTFTTAGNYDVRLIAKSSEGCTDTMYFSYIFVEASSTLEVPNVFSPNGDGKNDVFKVKYKSLSEFDAKVLNRWGRLLYSWTDPVDGWDGKINGTEASGGVYYYVIKAKGMDGIEYDLKGFFHLYREK